MRMLEKKMMNGDSFVDISLEVERFIIENSKEGFRLNSVLFLIHNEGTNRAVPFSQMQFDVNTAERKINPIFYGSNTLQAVYHAEDFYLKVVEVKNDFIVDYTEQYVKEIVGSIHVSRVVFDNFSILNDSLLLVVTMM